MQSKQFEIKTDRLKSPLVSVIVTNFNYERYIEACLQSIADQTYTNFECVIVDDVSQDNSVKIIERFINNDYESGLFRLVRHVENQGQMAAFQTGLEHTSGRFVVFVDADDLLLPDFIESHIKAHLNSTFEAALSNSDQFQIADDGQVLSCTHMSMQKNRGNMHEIYKGCKNGQAEWDFPPEQTMTYRRPDLPLQYYNPWDIPKLGWLWSTTSSAMFRRDVLDMVMTEECRCLRVCADSYIFHFAHGIGGTLIIPTVHCCYRRHGKNAFSNNPITGSFHSPGDINADPKALSNQMSFLHVIKHFNYFCAVISEEQVSWLLNHFGDGVKFIKLTLSPRTFPKNMYAKDVRALPENIFFPNIFRSPNTPWKIITRIIGRYYLKTIRYVYQIVRYYRNSRADQIKLSPEFCTKEAAAFDR